MLCKRKEKKILGKSFRCLSKKSSGEKKERTMMEKLSSSPSLSLFIVHAWNHHHHFMPSFFGDRQKNDCMVVLRKRTRPQRALCAAQERNCARFIETPKEQSGRLVEGFRG